MNFRRKSSGGSNPSSSSAVPTLATLPMQREARTDPATPGQRPSDILIARFQELRKICKSLTSYFENIAKSHAFHSSSLNLASSANTVPAIDSTLFSAASGWASLLQEIRVSTGQEANSHLTFSRIVQEEVLAPLKQLRADIKTHIADMDKEVNSLANEVVKKREASVAHLTSLSASLAYHTSSPLTLSASDDPFIVRAAAEQQITEHINLENELLTATLKWQERSRDFEQQTFDKIKHIWEVYDTAKADVDQSVRTRAGAISARIAWIPSELEWNSLISENRLIPSKTEPRSTTQISYPNRDHPITQSILQGSLERQKNFMKSWKEVFLVMTPSGFLHEYATNSSPLSAPALSTFLPHCKVGEYPAAVRSLDGQEITFTIEGKKSSNTYRAKNWLEGRSWWQEVERFTTMPLPERQGSVIAAVSRIGTPSSSSRNSPQNEGSSAPATPATPATAPPPPPRPGPRRLSRNSTTASDPRSPPPRYSPFANE